MEDGKDKIPERNGSDTEGETSMARRLERLSYRIVCSALIFIFIMGFFELCFRLNRYGMGLMPPEKPEQKKTGPVWELEGYDLFPYLMYRAPGDFTDPFDIVQTNSLGFRSPEFDPDKPGGVWRMVVLGGSAVWGVGVGKPEESFVGILNSLLEAGEEFERVEVINAGQLGFNSTQELIFLQNEILEYDPDFILFYDGFNDMNPSLHAEQLMPEGTYWSFPSDFVHIYDNYSSNNAAAGPIMTEIAMNSLVFRFIRRLILTAAGLPVYPDSSGGKLTHEDFRRRGVNAISKYGNNLDLALALLNKKNIGAAVAVQPFLAFHKEISEDEKKFLPAWHAADHSLAVEELYPSLVETARKTADGNGMVFWDFTTLFDGNSDTIYRDIVHYNDMGHRIVAEELARRIQPFIRKGE